MTNELTIFSMAYYGDYYTDYDTYSISFRDEVVKTKGGVIHSLYDTGVCEFGVKRTKTT